VFSVAYELDFEVFVMIRSVTVAVLRAYAFVSRHTSNSMPQSILCSFLEVKYTEPKADNSSIECARFTLPRYKV
jgi:hypothetical protein